MGCACLLALAALISGRLALVLVWIFTPLVTRAFMGSFILPLLGLLFLPFTTLAYVLVWTPVGLSPWGWLLLIFAFIVDIGSYGSGAYGRRR